MEHKNINMQSMMVESVTRTSLFSNFNKFIEEYNVLLESCSDKQFLAYVRIQEEQRLIWAECSRERQQMKIIAENANNEVVSLQKKLETARKMIDEEKKRYYACVNEKYRLLEQLESIQSIVYNDDNDNHDVAVVAAISTTTKKMRLKLSPVFQTILSRYPNFCRNQRKPIDPDATFSNQSYCSDNTYSSRPSSNEARISVCVDIDNNNSTTHGYYRYRCSSNMRRYRSYSSDEFVPIDSSSSLSSVKTSNISSCSSNNNNNNNNIVSGHLENVERRKLCLQFIYGRPHKFVPKLSILSDKCLVCDNSVLFRQRAVQCEKCHVHCHADCSKNLPLPCFLFNHHQPSSKAHHHHHQYQYPDAVPLSSYVVSNRRRNINRTAATNDNRELLAIPGVLVYCVREIEKRLPVTGLYQQQITAAVAMPSDKKKKVLRTTKQEFFLSNGQQTTKETLSNTDVHGICSLVKQFFNSLSHTLIPFEAVAAAVPPPPFDNDDHQSSSSSRRPRQSTDVVAKMIVERLDEPSKHTLAFLMSHLQAIVNDERCGRETSLDSLAIIFGPILVGLGTSGNSEEIKRRMKTSRSVVTALLNTSWNFWLDILDDAKENEIPR